MGGRAIRMMVSGAGTGRWLAILLTVLLLVSPHDTNAQLGPVDIDGFLEYQYRRGERSGPLDVTSQLGTFRTNLSTYLWRPWILQVNASLGLTRTITDNADADQKGTLITGDLRVDLFQQSRFASAAYVESRDSRVDGDLSGTDVLTRTYGFMQQYEAKRGGRYSLDYRRRTVEDLLESSSSTSRAHVNDTWQVNARKTLGRNQFAFNSELTDISRSEPEQFLGRTRHTLRHRFRSGNGFFLEDTTFFSSELFEVGDFDSQRRFLQFNGVSTWRPRRDKPLVIVGRGLLQGTDTRSNGIERDSNNMALTGSASYQYSDRVVFAANAGIVTTDTDDREDSTSLFQRLRTDYRSTIVDISNSQYRWGGSAEVGNRTGRDDATTGN